MQHYGIEAPCEYVVRILVSLPLTWEAKMSRCALRFRSLAVPGRRPHIVVGIVGPSLNLLLLPVRYTAPLCRELRGLEAPAFPGLFLPFTLLKQAVDIDFSCGVGL